MLIDSVMSLRNTYWMGLNCKKKATTTTTPIDQVAHMTHKFYGVGNEQTYDIDGLECITAIISFIY